MFRKMNAMNKDPYVILRTSVRTLLNIYVAKLCKNNQSLNFLSLKELFHDIS